MRQQPTAAPSAERAVWG